MYARQPYQLNTCIYVKMVLKLSSFFGIFFLFFFHDIFGNKERKNCALTMEKYRPNFSDEEYSKLLII